MVIKHLVVSGGGPTGFLTYGAARYLAKKGFWDPADIESIYGCSIGAFMGVVISLKYEWDWLDDYFIKRPWEKVVGVTPTSILDAFDKKGVLGDKFLQDSLEPLFSAKELDVAVVTLAELYAFNGIDIHIYTTNLNGHLMQKIDMSHTTHPDVPVVKALRMSTAYPFAFEPVCEDGKCYIDGGMLNIYPLNDCIEQTKCNKDEILAFKNVWVVGSYAITEESSIIDFLLVLLRKMQRAIDSEPDQDEVKHTVRCLIEDLDGFPAWMRALSTEENRTKLINKGEAQAKLFLSYLNS